MTGNFKKRLQDGERLVVFAVGRMFHPNLVHYLGMQGRFDGFWIDTEHGGMTTREVESAVTAGLAHGLQSFVRVPPTDYATVTRCFESGAVGVMASQIQSAQQTEEFVQWSKFAPRGRRGLNSLGYDGQFGALPIQEFTEQANASSVVGVQIETAQALEEVEDIASIDGIDFLFVGPSDLSQALGVTGDFMNEKCVKAVERIATACSQHDKQWGAVTPNPEYADLLVGLGCTLISPTNDVKLVTTGLSAVEQQFSSLF